MADQSITFKGLRVRDFPRSPVTASEYRRDIDGLRAVAVLLVVIFHAFPKALSGGFIGVDIFFVISGYLITGIIIRDLETSTFSIANFYARRIRRIFPALLTILLFTLAAGWLIFLPNELISLGKNIFAGALFAPNLMLLSEVGYFDTAAQLKPLLHLWSLGIEEQFYAAFPLFLIGLTRWKRSLPLYIAALAVFSFVLNVAFIKSYPSAIFYLPFTRAWELMVGCLLALPQIQKMLQPQFAIEYDLRATFAAILIAIGAVALKSTTPYPGWGAFLPVMGAALVISASQASLNRVLLSSRVLVFIGLISYPLYLWHWPLLSFSEIIYEYPATPLFGSMVVVASAILAYFTYRFIELPLRTGGFRFAKVAGLCTAMVLVCLSCVIIIGGVGFPARLDAAIREVSVLQPAVSLQQNRCALNSATQSTFAEECLDAGSSPIVLVWGDSTAAALVPGFRHVQQTNNFRLGQFTVSSCWPIADMDMAGVPKCREMNDKILSIVERLKPEVVVLEGIWSTGFEELGKTVGRLKALNVPRVIVMGRVPVWNIDLPTSFLKFYLLHHELIPARWDLIHTDLDWKLDSLMKKYVEAAGGEFVSIYAVLCSNDGCLTRAGGTSQKIIVRDRLHLTEAGSIFLITKLEDSLFANRLGSPGRPKDQNSD